MKLTDLYNNITEAKVEDPVLAAQIKEYAEISDSLDRAKAELKKIESKYKELEGVIRPILEELQETQDKALEVEDILVTIKRRGYDRTSYAYKEALEWVRDRINPAMRKIVDDSLEATKKPSYIASQIGVQKLKEEKGNSKLKMYFVSYQPSVE
jgi:chromosome segregation ATPase